MKTKVTILGEAEAVKPELKKIEFIKCLEGDIQIKDSNLLPCNFEHIELICINYGERLDLMFAYDSDRSKGVLYLGNFNDGVV